MSDIKLKSEENFEEILEFNASGVHANDENIKGLNAFDKFLLEVFPSKLDDNLEKASIADRVKLFPIASMSIILLLGVAGMRINYNMEINRNTQVMFYKEDLKTNVTEIEKNILKMKESNALDVKVLAENKNKVDGILKVMKGGGKVQGYEFQTEAFSTPSAVADLTKINEDWAKNSKLINVLMEKSKISLENNAILRTQLNSQQKIIKTLMANGSDANTIKEVLILTEKSSYIISKLVSYKEVNKEQFAELIVDLKSLSKLLSSPDLVDDANRINSIVDFFEKNDKDFLEFNGVVAGLSNNFNTSIDLFNKLGKTISADAEDMSILTSVNFYRISSTIIFLIALVTIASLSILFKSENKKLVTIADKLNKNQNNDKAVADLLDVMTPIDNGDFTHKINVEDKFLMQIAEKMDKTRMSFSSIVGQIKNVSSKILVVAKDSDETSKRLLDVTGLQYEKVGESINQIGLLTNEMDELAQLTWTAQEESNSSKLASQDGAILVKQSIQKMDSIRMTIQDSAKKIKKLSESAQSITEVTGLIQGITKQINVLALNAAIQAASSGESGREFTVVAQEVQRLARDSEEATRTIEEFISEIQADTASAVASMEKTTQEVVAGAKLTDSVGVSLKKIDELSMSAATTVAAASGKLEEKSIQMATISLSLQGLQKLTEQSSDVIKITADQVEEFKGFAIELDSSVVKYKI